jgi:hypothetical protein
MENTKTTYGGEFYSIPYIEMGSWLAFMKELSICELNGGYSQIEFYDKFSKYKLKKLPIVGYIYNCFDDGKIKRSRLYTVKVVEIIPFNLIDKETLKVWESQVEQCDWLYSKKTDYFIKTDEGEDGEAVFVRTKCGGWFSLGDFMNSGRLDVDGQLTEILNNY